jgi:hypothetical protein
MSVSTEVQRTLVKSPPELWTELSDPEALARHLGDFGEIKITSVEPETKVEWEAEEASGIVHLKQSGWGTKVTLAVTRNPPTIEEQTEPEPMVEPEPEAVAEPETTVEAESEIVEPEVATTQPEIEAEPVAAAEHETVVEPEPKLGFFARLFRKRKTEPTIVAGPKAIVSVEPEPDPEPEVVAMAAPEPIYPEPPPEPVVDLAAELASVEAQMTEETTELLTGVLDRLGAAHHRPFSRG